VSRCGDSAQHLLNLRESNVSEDDGLGQRVSSLVSRIASKPMRVSIAAAAR
jgi:hypothetical protein